MFFKLKKKTQHPTSHKEGDPVEDRINASCLTALKPFSCCAFCRSLKKNEVYIKNDVIKRKKYLKNIQALCQVVNFINPNSR